MELASNKRKVVNNELTFEYKLSLIKDSEEKLLSQRQLASKYDVSKSQVQRILANKENIKKQKMSKRFLKRSRPNPSLSYGEVDKATHTWFCNARSYRIPINSEIIQQKAIQFSKSLNPESKFTASNGWLEKFLKRHEISFKALSGEGAAVNQEVVNNWLAELDQICKNYELRDIYNIDETGLFYAAKPKKSYVEDDDACLGGKQSKKRLTVCLFTNSVGEKENPIIIGNAKRPRVFGRLDVEKLYGIYWRHNRTSWMTATIFEEILKMFNRKMKLQHRKVLLFLDNATCHPSISLSNVKLLFLPANTTSCCQPLDQGIINAFKMRYRKKFVIDLVNKIDAEMRKDIINATIEFNPSVLEAICWISEAWKEVKPETIVNCFRKCGFASGSATVDEINEEVSFDGILSTEDAIAFANFDNNEAISEPDNGFHSWENNYVEFIENGGNVFEFEDGQSPEQEQTQPDENSNLINNIAEKLKSFREVNEFALRNGQQDLFISTQKTIRELERIQCGSTLVQPSITRYFRPDQL